MLCKLSLDVHSHRRCWWSTCCVPGSFDIAKSTLTWRTGPLCAMPAPSSATVNLTTLSLQGCSLGSWSRTFCPLALILFPLMLPPWAELGLERSKSLFIWDSFQVIWNSFLGHAPGRFPFCVVLQTWRTHWKAHWLSCLNNYLQT